MNNNLNLYQRLNNVMKEVTTVFKGTEVSMGGNRSYSAVSHDDVTRLIHLPLVNNGIFVEIDIVDSKLKTFETISEYQGKSQTKISYLAEVTVQATFVNIDDPSQKFSVKSYAYAIDSSDKAVGKAESMAVKYIYLKNLLLESTDEEESRDYEIGNKQPKPAPSSAKQEQKELASPAKEPAAITGGGFRKNKVAAVQEEL